MHALVGLGGESSQHGIQLCCRRCIHLGLRLRLCVLLVVTTAAVGGYQACEQATTAGGTTPSCPGAGVRCHAGEQATTAGTLAVSTSSGLALEAEARLAVALGVAARVLAVGGRGGEAEA